MDLTTFFQGAMGHLADWSKVIAALIIGFAAVKAALKTATLFLHQRQSSDGKEELRLRLGMWLAVALEFELAADILRTAIAPILEQIALLASIAANRAALNYFLQKEIARADKRESADAKVIVAA
jgi:uncharacterized membrane protein